MKEGIKKGKKGERGNVWELNRGIIKMMILNLVLIIIIIHFDPSTAPCSIPCSWCFFYASTTLPLSP
jgi:hypothetical protein